jgi:hypothetical protein
VSGLPISQSLSETAPIRQPRPVGLRESVGTPTSAHTYTSRPKTYTRGETARMAIRPRQVLEQMCTTVPRKRAHRRGMVPYCNCPHTRESIVGTSDFRSRTDALSEGRSACSGCNGARRLRPPAARVQRAAFGRIRMWGGRGPHFLRLGETRPLQAAVR